MSKYHNIKTEIDGHVFDSRREAERYIILRAMNADGSISSLTLQPELPIVINDVKVCKYIADFRYEQNGRVIFEDAKGIRTAVYRLKKKLVKAVYDIDIVEV
jgi:hypothetical protein